MNSQVISPAFAGTYEKKFEVKDCADKVALRGTCSDPRNNPNFIPTFTYDISKAASFDLGKALIDASGIKEPVKVVEAPAKVRYELPALKERVVLVGCGPFVSVDVRREGPSYEFRQDGSEEGQDVIRFGAAQGRTIRDALARLFPFENGEVIAVKDPSTIRTPPKGPQQYRENGNHEWEAVADGGLAGTTRLRVPGGWLYRDGRTVTTVFVPMPDTVGYVV